MSTTNKRLKHSRGIFSAARLPILGLVALLSGCALSSREAFDEVGKNVDRRIGQRIEWNRESPDDTRVQAWLRSALEGDLTPDKAVAIALMNNRKLQAIYESLGFARADLFEAGRPDNPVFSGSYQSGVNGDDGPEVDLDVGLEIISLLTIPIRMRIAKDEFEATKLDVAREVISLASETRGQYYVVQADEQMFEMLMQVVEATSASTEAMRRLVEAGNFRDLDLAMEQAIEMEARLDLDAAQLQARKNRERLNILMGLWGDDTNIRIPPRMPEPPAQIIEGMEIERKAIVANLELEQMSHHIQASARALGLTKWTAMIPSLDLGAAFTDEADGNNLFGPAAALRLPIFNQGQGRVTAAQAELRLHQARYYYRAVEVRAAARASWDHLQMSRRRATYFRDVALPLRRRILDETQLQFNAMQVGVFHLLAIKRDEIETGKDYIENLLDFWLARTEVESVLSGHVTEFGMQTTALDSVVGSPLH